MLMQAVSHQHGHRYAAVNAKSAPVSLESQKVEKTESGVAPHIGGKHPLFLSRNRQHMSRRKNDSHVTQAMDDKVELFKTQIEQLAADKHKEVQQHEEGLMINDALRYDNALMKAVERKKTQEFLKAQIAERDARIEQE